MGILYRYHNGPSTAASMPPKVTTGTAIKTMMQLKAAASGLMVVEWGISFDGSAAGTPIQCELMDSSTVAATVTAYVAADGGIANGIIDPIVTTNGLTLGTAASGYTATAEGTVTSAARTGDLQLVAPTNQYLKQFPLGQGFYVPGANYLRIRVTAAATVNCWCYIVYGLSGD